MGRFSGILKLTLLTKFLDVLFLACKREETVNLSKKLLFADASAEVMRQRPVLGPFIMEAHSLTYLLKGLSEPWSVFIMMTPSPQEEVKSFSFIW